MTKPIKTILIFLAILFGLRVIIGAAYDELIFNSGSIFAGLLLAGLVIGVILYHWLKNFTFRFLDRFSERRNKLNRIFFYILSPFFIVIFTFLFSINTEILHRQILYETSLKHTEEVKLTVKWPSKSKRKWRWLCYGQVTFEEYDRGSYCISEETYNKIEPGYIGMAQVIKSQYGLVIQSISWDTS